MIDSVVGSVLRDLEKQTCVSRGGWVVNTTQRVQSRKAKRSLSIAGLKVAYVVMGEDCSDLVSQAVIEAKSFNDVTTEVFIYDTLEVTDLMYDLGVFGADLVVFFVSSNSDVESVLLAGTSIADLPIAIIPNAGVDISLSASLEVMGVAPAGFSSIKTTSKSQRVFLSHYLNELISGLVCGHLKPLIEVLSLGGFLNGLVTQLSMGSSMNSMASMVSIASRVGFNISMSDVSKLSVSTPLVHELHTASTYRSVGGVAYLMKILVRYSLLTDGVKATVGSVRDGMGRICIDNRKVTREPIEGRIIDLVASKQRRFCNARMMLGSVGTGSSVGSFGSFNQGLMVAPAKVFKNYKSLLVSLEAGELTRDVVVVVHDDDSRSNAALNAFAYLNELSECGINIAVLTDGVVPHHVVGVPIIESVFNPSRNLLKVQTGDLVEVDASQGAYSVYADLCESVDKISLSSRVKKAGGVSVLGSVAVIPNPVPVGQVTEEVVYR